LPLDGFRKFQASARNIVRMDEVKDVVPQYITGPVTQHCLHAGVYKAQEPFRINQSNNIGDIVDESAKPFVAPGRLHDRCNPYPRTKETVTF
jgi:hypothetical protein